MSTVCIFYLAYVITRRLLLDSFIKHTCALGEFQITVTVRRALWVAQSVDVTMGHRVMVH